LIFLRYADYKFTEAGQMLKGKSGSRHEVTKEDYQAKGILFVPQNSRFSEILKLPEGTITGQTINDAMKAIEAENSNLKDALPKNYSAIEKTTLVELLKLISSITVDKEGDVFGKIYEYFLGNFASSEGAKGGEFYTPTSLVKLIVEIIEPFHGKIFDPACGSGGMFVQSAHFVENHQKSPDSEISVYGEEKTSDTVRLCKMNLAVHGLEGDIREGNTYYEDLHNSTGKFDFVMANPPFNVDKIDKERLKDDPRFPIGLPKTDNGNYLWIQIFYSALNANGRAGFVMANSATDARASEEEIREALVKDQAIDAMVSIGPNFFYTVVLPCSLWFLDRGKKNSKRADKVLFLDARNIFRQVDRAHREFTEQQIEYLANIVRLYRGEETENRFDSSKLMLDKFRSGYKDVPGLCKVASLKEIEAQGWSLNPGRYVGLSEGEPDEFDYKKRLEELNNELKRQNDEAHILENHISSNGDNNANNREKERPKMVKVKLKDVCDTIFSGGTPDTRKPEYWNGDYCWLSSGETRSRFIHDTEKKITMDGITNSSTKLAKKGDVLIASAGQGQTRGQTSYCEHDTYINQSIIAIRVNPQRLNSLFLFYYLNNNYVLLRNWSDGNSIRGSLTCKMFETFEIAIPADIDYQTRVANYLYTFDLLAANNLKRNQILGEIVQKQYIEWFVKAAPLFE
jgi:type I restriction enzyme M protein